MAVAVQSSSSTAWADASSVVITKPTGLVVSDLMVASISTTANSVNTPTGWTLILNTADGISEVRVVSFYKIATSSDVSATDFTFTLSSTTFGAGGILRIDGHSQGTPIWASNGAGWTGAGSALAPTFADTVTTAIASSLIIFPTACSKANAGATIGTYAVVTSNPTWTEQWDMNTGGSGNTYVAACATATRLETTATGDSSITISVGTNPQSLGQLIVIVESKDVTISDTTLISDSVLFGMNYDVLDEINTTDNVAFGFSINVSDVINISDTSLIKKLINWTNKIKSSTIWRKKEK